MVNLNSAMQATGLLDGISKGTYMATDKKVSDYVTHPFILNSRVYEANGKDGTIRTSMTIFGKRPIPDAKYGLSLDFILIDGTQQPAFIFDVTQKMDNIHNNNITIELGVDDPIVLPIDVIGDDITIGDWEDVYIPIM